MAKARPIPDLSCADPMALGAARILEVRTAELREHSEGVLNTEDIERVHAMRVATRRLRAALEVFESCFPKPLRKAALREVKAMADALGERRDRDVAIAFLEDFEADLPAPDRRGVGSFADTLKLEQARANEDLASVVAPERVEALCERLLELAAEARRSAVTVAPNPVGGDATSNGTGRLP